MTRSLWSALALAGVTLAAPQAFAQTEFIANSFYNAEHPLSKYTYVDWGPAVEKASGGDLVPDIYTGTVLLAPRATLQGIRDNVVQVGHHPAVYTPSEMPVAMAVQELGFFYSDALPVLLAVTDWSMNNPTQLAEWKDTGVVYLGGYSTPPYILFCREPVTNLEEIKGKRIRTAGSTVSEWVEEVGGIPVNVPSSEMYSGLDRGTLDCASNAGSDLIERSIWEVAPHTTTLSTGMYYSGPAWGYNPDFWASLTPEQRKILMTTTARAIAQLGINYTKRANEALDEAAAKGNTIHEPGEDLVASVKAFQEKSLANIYTTAEEKYGLENGKEVIDSFRATVDKYNGLLEGIDRNDEDALTELIETEIYDKLDPATYGVD
ncbi:C4-dicarboxylate TRAP transporter substrate-binding protein [Acuticoccus mangrovi]|uniref:C4-dicarboxylate TRAP transporter substrate-binding protein n=1 Tax=Acuticoccus mangrovi TaxID=2796142 RepID=A0A934IW39_9HYPH|nr:C4-dicarboxylate TRAP transporter substrate-binding protein [Acuticoccus mangrovi]MBJ3778809.1 C4-dicarboxylate TRAP transporter substrate-binding protein [Acuticoccus mangrovi]